MKKLSLILSVLVFVSCKGERGPTGPEGPPGPVGQAFEVQASFNESNDYSAIFAFPDNVQVLETDIVAVYLLWEVDPETGNDVWQPLPVSIFFDDGQLQYAFDHTVADVQLFLVGDTNLNAVGDQYTQDQIFRIAILPVDYVESQKIDLSNIDEVMNAIKPSF
jgi:hypothetical protein